MYRCSKWAASSSSWSARTRSTSVRCRRKRTASRFSRANAYAYCIRALNGQKYRMSMKSTVLWEAAVLMIWSDVKLSFAQFEQQSREIETLKKSNAELQSKLTAMKNILEEHDEQHKQAELDWVSSWPPVIKPTRTNSISVSALFCNIQHSTICLWVFAELRFFFAVEKSTHYFKVAEIVIFPCFSL